MKDGTSPLFIEAQKSLAHVCTLILENHAHVNQKRNDGVTPLMTASFVGDVEVCEVLLLNNVVIDLEEENGYNALVHAVCQKKYDTCKFLIQHGIDVNLVGNDGKSVLETTNARNDETIISLIKQHKHINDVNKEIKETRKHLKKLQTKQIVDTKREVLAEMHKQNLKN